MGQGTTFRLYFPALLEPSETAERALHAAKAKEESVGHGERILLVEDEDTVRELAAAVLESHGYVVYPAATFAEALALAQEHEGKVDLLLSDQILPDGTGLALAERLRAMRPHLAVLITSGYHSIEPLNGKKEEYLFLAKPFTMVEFLQAVRRALEQAHVRGEEQG